MPPQQQLAITTLSRRHRRIYVEILVTVFIVAVPLLFLYATGYRFDSFSFAGLTKTGGIYVGAEEADTEIYLNNELVHETGTFRRAFYIQDLKPGVYSVKVSKIGFYPWEKTLTVFEHRVTEAQAFNIPEQPTLILIPSTFTNQTTNGTTTATVPNPQYLELVAAFSTTTPARATTTRSGSGTTTTGARTTRSGTSTASRAAIETATTTKESRGMRLYEKDTQIIAEWTRDSESAPFYLCDFQDVCSTAVVLNTKGEKPSSFDFFLGTTDQALVTLSDGVYVTELDNRSGQNIQPLFLARGADFRIIDGSIFIKSDSTLYKVEL